MRDGTLLPVPVGVVPEVFARGQGELFDVLPHPDFATNRLLYLSYARPKGEGSTTAVVRGRFEDDRFTGVEDVFEAQSQGRGHYGGRLTWGRDGLGGRSGGPPVGRSVGALCAGSLELSRGVTVRLHDDGRVPDDNPFIGQHGTLPRSGATDTGIRRGCSYTRRPAACGPTNMAGFRHGRAAFFVGGMAGQQLARLTSSVDRPGRIEQEETLAYGIGRVPDVRQGRLPPRRRQPDGAVLRVSDASVLGRLLSHGSGRQLVYDTLARETRVAADTVRRWIASLCDFHLGFLLRPWYRNVSRALRKEPKWYLRDWVGIEDAGARSETFVACHLLKAVDGWNDMGLGRFELGYLRDKDKREVDFVVARDGSRGFSPR